MLSKIKQNFTESLFLKSTAILFVGTMIVNVLNYIFNLVIGRLLSISEYGDLVSLESICMIIGVLGGTLAIAVTRKVSTYKAKKDFEGLRKFKQYFEKVSLIFGFLVCFILLCFSGLITKFLQTPFSPLIILDISFIFIFLAAFYNAILQGLQRFKTLSILGVIGAALKLVIGISLVTIGLSTTGAIIGYIFPTLLGVFAIYFLIRDINRIKIKDHNQKIKLKAIHFLALSKYFFATLCLTLLYNTDLLMVKHFFSPEDAGLYSSLAVLARIIFFGTGVLAVALLPMATEKYEKGEKHLHLFVFSSGLIAVLATILTIIYFLFPNLIISLLFGNKYLQGANLLGYMAIMMAVYTVLHVAIVYLISIKNFRFLWPLIIGTIIQPILITFFHTSLLQVIMISLIIISLIFVYSIFVIYKDRDKSVLK